MRRIFIAIVLVGVLLSPAGVRADDAPGCEGLERFRADLFPVGEQWADELEELGVSDSDWDPLTMSSDDWVTFAEIALAIHRELKAVDAPDWVMDWMQVRLDTTALQEQIGKAVAEGGILVILGFNPAIDGLDQRDDQTREAAIAQCADFAQFAHDWDALDGEIDGTPVPTPTR
jgi:hypothetical protein